MKKNTTLEANAARPEESPAEGETPRIVTSAHLATSYPELSEFEYGLIVSSHAFERWIIRCMNAAGAKDMAALDILILHHVNHRGKEKRLADICFVLHIEDTHLVSYSLKKLAGLGFVQSQKKGKEVFYATTEKGEAMCSRYKEVRDSCLVSSFAMGDQEKARLSEFARFLRSLSGLYDQASRAASSY